MSTRADIKISDIRELPQAVLISLAGEIDEVNLGKVKKRVQICVHDEDVSHLVFNFRDLVFINSTVVGYLLALYIELNELKKGIVIVEPNQKIKPVLSVVGLTSLISHYETMDEAIEALGL